MNIVFRRKYLSHIIKEQFTLDLIRHCQYILDLFFEKIPRKKVAYS